MAFCCADIDTLVHAYLDGELAAHDLEELEQHVARCAGCRARVDEELQFRAELRHRLTAPPASDLLRARVTSMLDAEDRAAVAAQRRRGASWILPGAASLAAAAALVMVVVVPAGDDEPAGTPPAPSNENKPDRAADNIHSAPIDVPLLRGSGLVPKQASFNRAPGRSAAQVLYEVQRADHSRHEMKYDILPDAPVTRGQRIDLDGLSAWAGRINGLSALIIVADGVGAISMSSSTMSLEQLVELASNNTDQLKEQLERVRRESLWRDPTDPVP